MQDDSQGQTSDCIGCILTGQRDGVPLDSRQRLLGVLTLHHRISEHKANSSHSALKARPPQPRDRSSAQRSNQAGFHVPTEHSKHILENIKLPQTVSARTHHANGAPWASASIRRPLYSLLLPIRSIAGSKDIEVQLHTPLI